MVTSEELTIASGTPPSPRAVAVPARRMPEVESGTHSWLSRFRRLLFFLVAHRTDAPEKAHLLTLSVEKPYETVCALVHLKTTATTVSYDELVTALAAHLDQRPSEVCIRTLSQSWDQLPGRVG